MVYTRYTRVYHSRLWYNLLSTCWISIKYESEKLRTQIRRSNLKDGRRSWGLGCVLPPKRCLNKTLAPPPLWNSWLRAWLCFPSSRITEHNLIWYVEKLQWKFISILTALFPFPYFYFHSHFHTHDIVIITPIPMGISRDQWPLDPLFPFPCTSLLHTSSKWFLFMLPPVSTGRRHNVFRSSVRSSVRPSVRYQLVQRINRICCKFAHVVYNEMEWNGRLLRSGQRWRSHNAEISFGDPTEASFSIPSVE